MTLVEIDMFGTVTKTVLGNQLVLLQEGKQVQQKRVERGTWVAAYIGNANIIKRILAKRLVD